MNLWIALASVTRRPNLLPPKPPKLDPNTALG